jgi:hypothetical protein
VSEHKQILTLEHWISNREAAAKVSKCSDQEQHVYDESFALLKNDDDLFLHSKIPIPPALRPNPLLIHQHSCSKVACLVSDAALTLLILPRWSIGC